MGPPSEKAREAHDDFVIKELSTMKPRFLDHSSLAVTPLYLRRLEGDRNTTWQRMAEALGLSP
jgi:hypothetical protein